MNQERIFKVLLGPHISEKATIVAEDAQQVVFRVATDATKPEIKKAVEQLFEVKVRNVQVLNIKGKTKRTARGVGKRNDVRTPAVAWLVRAPAPTTEAEAVEAALVAEGVIGSPGFPDPDGVADRARREWNRGRNPDGFVRQLAAILHAPSRTEALGNVSVPFTVIHGDADTLVTPSGGRRTAEAVPGARLEMIEGMGHNLPGGLFPRVTAILAETAAVV